MPSIAIVDDDARCREEIAEAARVFMDAQGEEYRVTAFADAASFLADAATRPFDIAILDIIMPEKSGLDAALELYERDQGCCIIFLTTSPDYAIQGYRVNAADYLLKPVDPEALGRALDRALNSRPDRNGGTNHSGATGSGAVFSIILREGREAKKVAASDILYCRSEGNNARFYGADFTISSRGKLDEFKARLPECFVQTHKRYLVNLDHVAAMTPEAMRLDNGDEVPVSRAFKESAGDAYFDHVEMEARKI